jgi:hypothetical protein
MKSQSCFVPNLWLTCFLLTQNCFRKIDFAFGMERVSEYSDKPRTYTPPPHKNVIECTESGAVSRTNQIRIKAFQI